MLSVCVVTQQYRQVVSGIGLHANNLVAWLVGDGHRVTVVAPSDQHLAGGSKFRFVGVPPPLFRHNQARWLSLAWAFARALRSLELKESFDLVHFTDARESLFCRLRAPVVGNINDTYAAEAGSLTYYRRHYADWALRWAYYQFVRQCEARALPRLQAVIANSHYTAEVVASQYRVSRERLYTCYKGIEPEQYSLALNRRRHDASQPFRVLFVGGNMQRKGLSTLIEAAPQILAALPRTEFWIVGGDAAAPRMQALCHAKGVETKFRFWGWRPHDALLNLYAQADVFVMPSLVEAFGVAFLEAMACGIPVIGTRVGGIPELIEHGHNGLLVSPGDAGELAQSLLQVLMDDTLRERLVEAGLETVRRFNVDRMMRCTYQVYEALLGYSPSA